MTDGHRDDADLRRALEDSEARLRALSDASFEAIFLSEHGICIDQNQAAERIFGYTRAEAIGRPGIEWIAPADRDKAMASMMSGREEPYEVCALRKDGTTFPCEIQGRMIAYQGRQVRATALRDITEMQRLREASEVSRHLELAGRVVGQVAHDYNNLLAPLTGYPELILEDLEADHPARSMVEGIKRVADRMAAINLQLLALSRRGFHEQEIVDMHKVVTAAVASLAPIPGGVEVSTVLRAESTQVRGAPTHLQQAVRNVLLNAVEATVLIGGGLVNVETAAADQDGAAIAVIITDRGPGIDDEIKPRIYDSFFTTKPADQRRGAGLGLSVVASVLEEHGGTIEIGSSAGAGTRVVMHFPLASQVEKRAGEVCPRGAGEAVLVVDDDHYIRDVAVGLLLSLGYQAEAVATSAEAIARIAQQPPDLVILDMLLGEGRDGADTLGEILARRPTQRAMIMSGYAESQRVEMAVELGAGAFIRKPLSRAALARAVRQALDR